MVVLNGEAVHEGCFSPDVGLAPYTVYYDGDERSVEMTLVSIEERG